MHLERTKKFDDLVPAMDKIIETHNINAAISSKISEIVWSSDTINAEVDENVTAKITTKNQKVTIEFFDRKISFGYIGFTVSYDNGCVKDARDAELCIDTEHISTDNALDAVRNVIAVLDTYFRCGHNTTDDEAVDIEPLE